MESFLTVNEVAKYLHLSNKTVYKMVHNGTLPAAHIGPNVRISISDIDKLLTNDYHRRHQVLIICESKIVRSLIKNTLVEQGYEVTCANDWESGFQLLQEIKFDKLFFGLNKIGGIEELKSIRTIDPNVLIAVIIGTRDEGIIPKIIKLGVTNILVKPINVPEIINAVTK